MSEELNDPFAGISGDEVNIDAFQQKLATLWVNAGTDPAERGKAMSRIVSELVALDNDFTASEYMTYISKEFKIKKTDLRKNYDKERKRRKLKDAEEVMTDFDLPEGVDFEKASKFGYYTFKNCYWFLGDKGKFDGSNFVMRPVLHVYSKLNNKRIVELENCYGIKKMVALDSKEFVSPELLQNKIIGEGNFIWKAAKPYYLKLLSDITNDFPICNEIRTLGWQREGFFAFSNGIFSDHEFKPVDEIGTVQHASSHYFLPAFSCLYASVREDDDEYENDRFYMYKKPQATFSQWCALMHNVYPGKASVAIGFAIAAIFRDLIYEKFKCFPHLFLFGEKQSGKSQLGWSLSNLYNDSLQPYNLNSGTQVAFFRRLARVKNGIVWYDEYTNDIDEKRFQSLKAAYDGAGHEKGLATADNRSEVTKVNSACIVSGQYLPTRDDNALLTRSVLLNFVKRKFSADDINFYNQLKSVEESGMTGIICELLHYRDMMDTKYSMTFDELFQANRDALERQRINHDERILRNYTVIQTVVKLFCENAKDIQLGVNYAAFSREIISMIGDHSQQIASGEALTTFWNMIEFLSDQSMLHVDKDFMITSRTSIILRTKAGNTEEMSFTDPHGREFPKTMLWIRLTKIHPLYMEYHRKQYGTNGIDKTTLLHYLTTNSAYLGYQDSARIGDINTSAYVFDYAKLKEMGVNLDRGSVDVNREPEAATEESKEDLSIKTEMKF